MPSPRKTPRSAIGGASFLKQGSPRLTKWTMQDAGYKFKAKVSFELCAAFCPMSCTLLQTERKNIADVSY